MALNLWSEYTIGGNCYGSPGYAVGGSRYGAFIGIPFKNNRNCTVVLKSLTLPLGYWSQRPNPRTVYGAVWFASRGPINGGNKNVMDLYDAARTNLSALRDKNNGNVSGNRGYEYWCSPWYGLGYSDKQAVLNAMVLSTNTNTPTDAVDRETESRAREYTFYFNDVNIPAGTIFYAGIYGSESACEGTSIAVRRRGFSSPNRDGSLDAKFYYDRGTMVACNYVSDYRGRWHFYNDYFTSNGHPTNYAQGPIDAKVTVDSLYDTPTITITSSGGGITKRESSVSVNYGANGASRKGSTYVQYNVNNSGWVTVDGSGNGAGTFSFTPSSHGVGFGANYSIKVRRVCTGMDFDNVSGEPSISMRTYHNVTMSGFKLSPASTVNANTDTTLTWTAFSSTEETATCKIDVLSGSTVLSTIATNLANNIVTKVFTPKDHIGIAYDNKNVTLRITRTGSITGYTASQTLTFKILYRPTDKVININPDGLGIIKENKDVTWGYPSGYKGIVSGYNITLTNTKGHIVNYHVDTNKCIIKTADLKPAIWYRIDIRAYYLQDNVYYYGEYTGIDKYLYFDKGIAIPTITYPISSGWIGNTYRIVFQLPEDFNFESLEPEEQEAYRYKDVEVVINNVTYGIKDYPNAYSLDIDNLEHKVNIVFSPTVIGIQSGNTNTIKVRVLSQFDTWSKYSNTVTMTNISLPKTKDEEEIIYFSDYKNIIDVIKSLCKSYGMSVDNDTGKDYIIKYTDINYPCSRLLDIIDKVNEDYTYDNDEVKFKEVQNPVIVAQGDIIKADHFSSLVSIISILTS